jgi:hypothetical protein
MTQLEPPTAPAKTASGAEPKKSFDKRIWFLVLAGLLVIAACAAKSSDSKQESVAPTTPSPTVHVAPTFASNSNETVSQGNARKSAKSYLDLAGFSRSGLITQLEFEGYSTMDATYGVDAQNANWNDQAARSAKSYLDMSGFSRSGLITQLEFEGFTQSQAEYGASANGL